jgi:hypothetical protein
VSSIDRPRRFRIDGHDAARLIAIVCMAIFAILMSGYVRDQWSDEAQFTHRDFHNFWNAGVRIRDGEPVYQRDEIPFLLTPLAAPFVVVLSWIPERIAFVTAAIVTGALYAVAIVLVALACPADRRSRITACFLAASMPPFWFALYLGQLSGLWLFLLAGAFVVLVRPRAEGRTFRTEIVAGVLVAALCVKPQLALVALLVAALRRSWGTIVAFVVVSAILWLASIPFLGVGAAIEWREQVSWCTEALEGARSTWWRQFTLYAFLRASTANATLGIDVARWLYLATALPMGIATLLAVRRALLPDDRRLALRAIAMLVLATVSLNAYLFYYDAAFLVVPWMIAYLAYQTYAQRTRALIVLVAAISWVLALTTPILEQGSVPFPGLVAAIWLGIEIIDFTRGERTRRESLPASAAAV